MCVCVGGGGGGGGGGNAFHTPHVCVLLDVLIVLLDVLKGIKIIIITTHTILSLL